MLSISVLFNFPLSHITKNHITVRFNVPDFGGKKAEQWLKISKILKRPRTSDCNFPKWQFTTFWLQGTTYRRFEVLHYSYSWLSRVGIIKQFTVTRYNRSSHLVYIRTNLIHFVDHGLTNILLSFSLYYHIINYSIPQPCTPPEHSSPKIGMYTQFHI